MPIEPLDPADGALLAEGELTLVGRIVHASNATLVCDASTDGRSVRCVYKPIRGEQPLWDFPDGTLAGREVASYLISEELGWGVIPPTILRDGPFGPGMVQRWIETPERRPEEGGQPDLVDICPPEEVPPGWLEVLRALDVQGAEVSLIHADDPRLQRMAVLDVVLNNADRKGGHALEGVDGWVYGVDHGICLHEENKLRTVLWGWAGTSIADDLLADLAALAERLSGDELPAVLAEHITLREIDALRDRVRMLVRDPVMPHPSGSRPIPWPAF
ncbi:SCO1664 family protein [Prescottella equi]|uniref:SCO1664 family protein n=1 Tax=Rhodococcus hoagii TaxID=43767 RepID=UPI003D9513D3